MIMDAWWVSWPLKNYCDIWEVGDATHTAISIYLETLITFSQGNVRQNPSVNSKKKPHSEEEEKEEEEQEEEEVATVLDGNDVSHEHVDMNACDHSNKD